MTSNSGDSPQSDRTELILDGVEDGEAADTLVPPPVTPDHPVLAAVDFLPDLLPGSTLVEGEPFPSRTVDSVSDASDAAGLGNDSITDPGVRHSVPGYEILRELGRGGMGVVYQARQKGLNRLVALKMILSGAHAGSTERERFRREAEAVAQLQHPNIVQIFEVGEADGRPYLAFEYVAGGSLASQLTGQPWPALQAAEFVEILARAVQFAHEQGIVHRDLKPGNILISRSALPGSQRNSDGRNAGSGTIKVTDFGLAKRLEPESDDAMTEDYHPSHVKRQTRTGAVMGTPSYIAPEQAAGKNKDVGPPADVYALAAILYELLTGRPPFRGETALDTVLQVMTDDPVPPRRLQPRIPRDLETICLKCLQKSPAKRYESAAALADDLRRMLNHQPIAARPIGYWDRGVKWAKRHPARATWALTSILAVLTLLAISISFNFRLREAADAKENEARSARAEREKADQARADAQVQAAIAKASAQDASDRELRAKQAEQKAKEANEAASKQLEISRRGEYALTLNQAMALGERDPQGASRLLLNTDRCPGRLRDFTWHMLRRMYLVEEQQVPGHGGPISFLSYSSDGRLLASAGWDGTVRILDLRTLQPMAVLRGHRGVVRSVDFAADSRMLATTGNDGTIRLWEIPPTLLGSARADAPLPILRSWALLTVSREAFRTAIFSPDGKRLAAGSEKGNLYLWDVPRLPRLPFAALAGGAMTLSTPIPDGGYTPEFGPAMPLPAGFSKERVRRGHTSDVSALVWTKEGLLSASRDKTILLWNLDDDSPARRILEHTQPIFALAYSSRDSLLAIVGDSRDEPSIRLWNMVHQKDVGILRGHTKTVSTVAFDPEGKLLASAAHDGTVRIWDPLRGQERCLLRGHAMDIRSVAFGSGRWSIASGGEHALRIWSLAGQREERIDLDGNAPLRAVAISADDRRLIEVDHAGNAKVWSLKPNLRGSIDHALAFTLKGPLGPNVVLAVSPNASQVAAASMVQEDWVVRLWNLPAVSPSKSPQEVKESRSWKVPGKIHGLAIHGNYLATAGAGGLQIWNLSTRQIVRELIPAVEARDTLSVVFAPDGGRLFSAVGKRVQIWNFPSITEVGLIETFFIHSKSREGIQMLALDVNPQGTTTLATVDELGIVCLWDVTSAHPTTDDALPRDAPILKQRCVLSGHMEGVTSLGFTPDGKTVATTSEDRTVRLWDTVSGQERAALTGHTDAVTLGRFFNEGRALLTIGREGHMRIWQGR